ncbi:MAG: ABC transporter ATP-binding protein [Prosthecobacter sp.]
MPDAPASGLHVNDLRFAYPGESGGFRLHVPRLDLEGGKALALAGPSGAGKSTLVRLLTGLLPPSAGQIHLGASRLDALSHEQRRAFRLAHIGLVFQDFALLDYLTVGENILLPHQFRGDAGTAARKRAHDLTGRLQISQYLDKRVSQLSQGERQRVAVARALVHEPQFIFADEPTASLDPSRGRIVVDLLIEDVRQRGACLVMVTHDPNLLPFFDQTVRMEDFAAPASTS